MAAPFAGAADAPDDASVPTPAAMMKAARITRISILLCTTEPFGRAHLEYYDMVNPNHWWLVARRAGAGALSS